MFRRNYSEESKRKPARLRVKITRILACVVVFITAYSLILPAVTINRESAEAEPGMVLESTADAAVQTAAEDMPENNSSDTDNTDASPEEASPAAAPEEAAVSAAGAETAFASAAVETVSAEDALFESVYGQEDEEDLAGASGTAAGGIVSEDRAQEMPAQKFTLTFDDITTEDPDDKITVDAEADEGAFPAGTTMTVSFVTDKNELKSIRDIAEKAVEEDGAKKAAEAYAAGDAQQAEEMTGRMIDSIRALDITFKNAAGVKVEPEREIRVTISSSSIADEDKGCAIVHVDDEGSGEVIDPTDEELLETAPEKDQVVFDTDAFSYYLIVGTTLTKTITASDGRTYTVSVTYGSDAQIPEGSGLSVSEITENAGTAAAYEEYVSQIASALGWNAAGIRFIRLFDIKIIDENGQKVEIAAPVDVKITLAGGETAMADAQVVHFADGAPAPDVIPNVTADGESIRFEAEGFSAYAIVEGPEAVPLGWNKAETVAEVIAIGSTTGLYVGHPDGYYFMNTLTADSSRSGITKTKPAKSYPPITEADEMKASLYYFEAVPGTTDQVYAYCLDSSNNRQYVQNLGTNSLYFTTEENKTAFTIAAEGDGIFTLRNGSWYWNMQGSAKGSRFCAWNANNSDSKISFMYYTDVVNDPYGLNGKAYGLMYWSGGVAGKAMMAASSKEDTLDALALTVLSKQENNKDRLFVPDDSDITMWTFEWISADQYYVKASAGGSEKYLKIEADGPSLSDTPDGCVLRVVPGTGVHEGEICLKSGNTTLTFSGLVADGFTTGGSTGNEWLYLVELSNLTDDYFMTYSASKVSISDPAVTTGSKVIIYTRSWNEDKKKYEFFAIDHDGTLVPCFEAGDSIEWVGNRINTLLWQFTEYQNSDGTPNGYYELYNLYSQKYLAPEIRANTILSDDTIGLNMMGRQRGRYYSAFLAWDEPSYAYASLKVENGQIVACPKSQGMDFYFAEMEELSIDDTLNTVGTVDNTQYGITMKIVDIGTRDEMSDYLKNNDGGLTTQLQQGLLSTDLVDDYPTAASGSLSALFAGEQEANHLFIESTYEASGYYEFDSAQNYAHLIKNANDPWVGKDSPNGGVYKVGDFVVYKEIASYDSAGSRKTLQHGQFFPFNDIEAGLFASINRENLYHTTGGPDELDDSDPRKHEQLYLIRNADCYFGVELEAAFTQTPSGLDAWGHDIIFEFTGDDDFWLYVDGELVIDLGGIHSAVPGSVNFRTGEVNVNGTKTTLYDLFYNNYLNRDHHTAAEAQAYVDGIFELNEDGQHVFQDYTRHTMRIFYFERGAGASNLHMRFNLAAVKKGTAQLSKTLSGVDTTETILAEFPYQIWYKTEGSEEEHLLQNFIAPQYENDPEANPYDYVFYDGTMTPVKFMHEFTIPGTDISYNDVFFLQPDETADISFPDNMTEYRIVECGVNTEVYSKVTVYDTQHINGQEIEGTDIISGTSAVEGRKDFGIGYASTDERSRVNYENEVDPRALRSLTFTKRLFDETGTVEIDDDSAVFSFRLYLGTEYYVPADPDDEQELPAAYIYTYHVKDENGYYCAWNDSAEKFVSTGISDYDSLTDAQKEACSFATSIYGSISRIPVKYTVEVRQLLAGTRFQMVERPWEIPDGYSFQKYIYNGEEQSVPALTGVMDTISPNADPHIDICNLKGWGLRINKTWTDADYMENRSETYFAVFTNDGNGNLTLVPNTVRQLTYSEAQSVYWYFQVLPAAADFDSYEIREVTISNTEPAFDEEGNITDPGEVTIIGEDGTVVLQGTQKGDTGMIDYAYTVSYERGEWAPGSNVRVDTAVNDRPGIILRKTLWDGETALEGAEFELTRQGADGSEIVIGTFTSGEDGMITTAYLGNNVDYLLTETKTPNPYHGLDDPLTIRMDTNGNVTVTGTGLSEDAFELIRMSGDEPDVLIVKNRPFTFAVIKENENGDPLADAHFALYNRVEVDGVITTEFNPKAGYGDLASGEDGLVELLDNALPAGSYAIKETAAPEGYRRLPETFELDFTISVTGAVTIDSSSYQDWLSWTVDETTGSIDYLITIVNVPMGFVLEKTDDLGQLLTGAVFQLSKKATTAYEAVDGYEEIDMAEVPMAEFSGMTAGSYRLEELHQPDGYVIFEKFTYFTLDEFGTVTLTDADGHAISSGSTATASVTKENGIYTVSVINTPGAELPNAGGCGTVMIYVIGIIMTAGAAILLMTRRMAAAGRNG